MNLTSSDATRKHQYLYMIPWFPAASRYAALIQVRGNRDTEGLKHPAGSPSFAAAAKLRLSIIEP